MEPFISNTEILLQLREEGYLYGNFLFTTSNHMTEINYNQFINFHVKNRALVSLLASHESKRDSIGIIAVDAKKKVIDWNIDEGDEGEGLNTKCVEGFYLINAVILDFCIDNKDDAAADNQKKRDLEINLLKPLAGSGLMYCYDEGV